MNVVINRDGNKICFKSESSDKFVGTILERNEFKHLNPLDIENFDSIKWEGIEFNNLYIKENRLYRFNRWIGVYPFTGVEIEEIGKII